ncbi:MAG TPA: hypothetical protein VN906_13415 [Candidatus Sulfotelmatobacter sp.]|nr:hypothetical protein [Candidatus Sulfotelmatobacter sp.]
MRQPSLSRYRVAHMHQCGHVDDCFLSRVDAEGSDCRECSATKFNRDHAVQTPQRKDA